MRATCSLAILAVTLLSGCGGLEVKRVTGRILVGGEPIPDIKAIFFPLDSMEQGTLDTERTDGEGRFVEIPDPNWYQGRAGRYRVQFVDPRIDVAMVGMSIMSGGKKIETSPPLIPLRYIYAEFTPLETMLEKGVNDLGDFDLPDEDNTEVVRWIKNRTSKQ